MALVGAYAGRRRIAWAPKFGVGGAFGDGFLGELVFNLASLGMRTRGLVVDFDVLSYRIRRHEIEPSDISYGGREIEHRMITGITFYKAMTRSERR